MKRRSAWAGAAALVAAVAGLPLVVSTSPAARAATSITYVGAGTGFSAGRSTLTVSSKVPAAARTGDLLVVSVTAERSLVPSLSGLPGLVDLQSVSTTNVSVHSAYTFLTAADAGATVTATVTAARRMAITAVVWRGVGSVGAVPGTVAPASGAVETTPTVTPDRDGSLLVGLIGHTSNKAPWTASLAAEEGWTEQAQTTSTHPGAANPTTLVLARPSPSRAGTVQSGASARASLAGQQYVGATLALGPQTERERRERTLQPGTDQPDAGNTGILPDVPRTPVTGNVTLSTPGQVYENKDVAGMITVKAANVTIRNVRVRGAAGYTPSGDRFLVTATDAAVSNLVIEHVTLRPDVPHWNWDSGITGHDFTLRFADISGTVDGVNVFNTYAARPYRTHVRIQQSYVHDLVWWTAARGGVVHPRDTQTHNDAVQHQGGWGTVITGNTLRGGPYAKQVGHWRTTTSAPPYASVPLGSLADGGPYLPVPDRGTGTEATGRYNWGDQANIMLNDNVGTTRSITVTDNWLYGGRQSVNGGGLTAVADAPVGTFLRNRFDRSQGDQGGGGNRTYTISVATKDPASVTTGARTADANHYLDGPEITVRVPAPRA